MSTTKVVTGVVRGSFVNLFVPVPVNKKPGAELKYGMVLLIPKRDTDTLAKIRAAQKAAAQARWPQGIPAGLAQTLHDGDGVRPKGDPFGPECKGHWVMQVSCKEKPGLVDRQSNAILDKGAVGSGDYFKVSINAFGYDESGNKGVSFGLNNVLFWEKGESLAGRARPEEDFADEFDRDDVSGGVADEASIFG